MFAVIVLLAGTLLIITLSNIINHPNVMIYRGFCPLCHSSPPLAWCVVCKGFRNYGPAILSTERRKLKENWVRWKCKNPPDDWDWQEHLSRPQRNL